jgi:5-methylcytosine-specific restriction protein B
MTAKKVGVVKKESASKPSIVTERLSEKSFTWEDAYIAAKACVLAHTPIILFGPPGTGKTRMIADIKDELVSEKKLGSLEVVQFHKKFSYEDFIEGYAPDKDGKFIKKDGVFKRFCRELRDDKKINLFVIDEINRAELSTTLGELLYLIEDRNARKVKTSHFGDDFIVSESVSIVGTMNTADRNIAIIDYALRRRFKFIPVFPDYVILKKILSQRGLNFKDIHVDKYCTAAKTINHRISVNRLMGRNMQLGHTMYVPDNNKGKTPEQNLTDQFKYAILPQLEIYCGFGNENLLEELLNPNIALKFLKNEEIIYEDIVALINDLSNDQSTRENV